MAKYNEPVVDTSTVNDKQVAFSNIPVLTTTPNYSGMSGTQIAEQIRSTNTAKDQAAQAAASKPEISVAGQARGDQLQWNPATKQYQIIKGVNVTQGPTSVMPSGGQPTGPTSTGVTGPATTTGTGPTSTLNQNALQLLTSTLQGYGLSGDIANGITGLLQKGYTSDTIQAVIQDPNAVNNADPSVKSLATAWQTRFAANTARQKAGLAVLDPATYLATEAQYKSVMLRAGIPSAAISNNYIAQLMGVDVSPAEVQQRIDAATTAVTSEDPYVIQQLNQMGLGKGDLVFHLLDPNTASNIIQQKVQSAQISAEAARQNVNVNQDYAMQLAAQGITQNQAQLGFTNIASQIAGTQEIAQRYGFNLAPSGVGQALQAATFGTADAAAAQQELKRLQTQEVSAFGGSAGASQQGQSLGVANQQGVQ